MNTFIQTQETLKTLEKLLKKIVMFLKKPSRITRKKEQNQLLLA